MINDLLSLNSWEKKWKKMLGNLIPLISFFFFLILDYFFPLLFPQDRLGINKLYGVKLFIRFSAKFVNISTKFRSLHVQIRNNWKQLFCLACKWCKISKYFVNSIIISCSTCQKGEKECIWVKYLIYAVSVFRVDKKKVYSNSAQGFWISKNIGHPT